jgi:hypothetical protein
VISNGSGSRGAAAAGVTVPTVTASTAAPTVHVTRRLICVLPFASPVADAGASSEVSRANRQKW